MRLVFAPSLLDKLGEMIKYALDRHQVIDHVVLTKDEWNKILHLSGTSPSSTFADHAKWVDVNLPSTDVSMAQMYRIQVRIEEWK